MIRKILKICFVLACMITIFVFSEDEGYASTRKSETIIVKFCELFVRGDLTPELREQKIEQYTFIVRKGAHFFIYFLLGLSIILLFHEYHELTPKIFWLSILSVFLYACSDEIHQLFVEGRDGNIFDVLLDTFGGGVSISIYWFMKKKKISSEK